MKKYLKIFLIVIICFHTASCSKKKTSILIQGSTTVAPITRLAALEYEKNHDVEIVITAAGSHKGINSLIEGKCDIADSSVPLTAEEKKLALEKGVEIREFIIAFDMIIPVVHPNNPVKNLSISQLKDIYTGRIRSWKKFGWKDSPIMVVNRDANSGTRDAWNNIVMNGAKEFNKEKPQPSNSGVLGKVSGNEFALGYISIGFVNRDVKAMSINGIKAELDDSKAKKFPVYRKLYMFARKDSLRKEVKSFIIYLLSKKYEVFIRKAGFLPTKSLKPVKWQ